MPDLQHLCSFVRQGMALMQGMWTCSWASSRTSVFVAPSMIMLVQPWGACVLLACKRWPHCQASGTHEGTGRQWQCQTPAAVSWTEATVVVNMPAPHSSQVPQSGCFQAQALDRLSGCELSGSTVQSSQTTEECLQRWAAAGYTSHWAASSRSECQLGQKLRQSAACLLPHTQGPTCWLRLASTSASRSSACGSW